jgi:hypothetical protein
MRLRLLEGILNQNFCFANGEQVLNHAILYWSIMFGNVLMWSYEIL